MFYKNFVGQCVNKGVSASEAAEAVGLSRASASGWKGGKVPSYTNLYKLADYFGCTIDDLLVETDTDTEEGFTQMLLERKEMRMLFDAAKNASPDVIRKAVKIIEALKDD